MHWNMLQNMSPLASDRTARGAAPSWGRRIVVKITLLTLLCLVLGFVQGWAAARFYRPDYVAGFHVGMVQGALMPAALPALLMGKDVPIYAAANVGRLYKIGYIFGINICGTLFFGVAMWQSRKQPS
jgi:hypothetical protein